MIDIKPWTVFSTIGNDRLTASASSNICKSSSPSSIYSVYGLQQSLLPESWRPSSGFNHQHCHRYNCFNWSECRWSSPNRKISNKTFQTGWPKTFYSMISREMRTHKKKLPIVDNPVIDQEVIYARLIGLYIINRSLDFNAILTSELSTYPPLMLDPTGQSTLKNSLQVEIPMPAIE